jgi:branched-chain amino acid transport system permease protein
MVVTPDYMITLITIGTIYALASTSLNFITGYAGLVSIGHAAFLAVGAYTEAILLLKYNIPFEIAFPASILVGALLGALLGLPSLRVSDDFLAVATIGINFIVVGMLQYSDFFGGTLGLSVENPSLFGIALQDTVFMVFALAMLAIAMAVSWWLQRSWAGLALAALREDPQAAESVGISTARFKIIAFTISGAFAGMAGALLAHYFGFITPGTFGFLLSVDILVFAVFGGLGSIWGPVVGAYFLYILPQFLRTFQNYRVVLYGLVLMVIIVVEPDGLMGLYRRASDWWTERNAEQTLGETA